jgi:hypothetical protein
MSQQFTIDPKLDFAIERFIESEEARLGQAASAPTSGAVVI